MHYIYIAIGLLCVVLGVLGIILPVLPTTPFLLLASWLFYKSSPKLRDWLLYHPYLGKYIENYQIHKAIPLRGKIASISMLWVTILISAIWFVPIVWVKILLIIIAIGVTIHILRFETMKEEKSGKKAGNVSAENSNSYAEYPIKDEKK